MDLVRVASQPSGLTPSTRAGPSLRAVDAQRPCVARLVFRPESLVQIAPLHELWALNDIDVGGWHASRTRSSGMHSETQTLTGSLACVEPAPCGLAAISWLVDLTPGESSVLKMHLTPRFAPFMSALMVGRTLLPINLHSLPLGGNKSVILCFFSFFSSFLTLLWRHEAGYSSIVQRCLEGVNNVSL